MNNYASPAFPAPSTPTSEESEFEESGVMVAEDEPPTDASSGGLAPMEDIEKQHILRVLKSTQGNRTHAAEILKLNIRTLRNKLSKYAEEGEDISGLG